MDRKRPTLNRQRLREEAATWVVRLAAPEGDRLRAEFEQWRDASVEHEIAFEREMAAWERLDALRGLGDEPAAIGEESDVVDRRVPVAGHRPRWRAALAVAASVVGAGVLSLALLPGSPAFATAIGERKLVRLGDGSSVELNTDSRIVVRYGKRRRLVELVRGEAMFHVAREARPFVIEAGRATLDTSAADASVRLDARVETITVRDGTILASLGTAHDRDAVAIGARAQASLAGDTLSVRPLSPDEIGRAFAWQQGAIALDGRTLAGAAAEFNRYNLRRIEVGDARAGAIRVGGYFRTSDVDGFVAAATLAFGVKARTDGDGDVVLTAR